MHQVIFFLLGPVYLMLFFGVFSFHFVLILELMGLAGSSVLDPVFLKLDGG